VQQIEGKSALYEMRDNLGVGFRTRTRGSSGRRWVVRNSYSLRWTISTAKGHPPKSRFPMGLIPTSRGSALRYKTSRAPFQKLACRQEDFRRWRDLHEYPTNEATVISTLLDVAIDGVESVKAMVKRHDSDKREETPGTVKSGENEANQLYRRFRKWRSARSEEQG
jgi:hypothetical protein